MPPFPVWAGPAERLRHLLAYAIQAPSRHNAQPWLFEVEGDELRVFVDPRRTLRAADPQGREAVIACGAAVENLRVAAAHHGHEVGVEPREPGRGGPVAVARLLGRRPPTAAEETLFAAIPARRSAAVIHPHPVPAEELAALAEEADGEASLRRVPRWLARPVAELVAEADAVQWSSGRYRAELAAWAQRARRAVDGLAPDRPQGPSAPAGLLRRLLRRAGRRDDLDRRADERTRTLLLLSTRGDGPRDWLAAGRAMQRLLLRAAAGGLAAALLASPTEVPDVRRRLRRELGEPGHPQVLVRVGYGPRLRPTPRRPVELVLRSFSTEIAVEVEIPAEVYSA